MSRGLHAPAGTAEPGRGVRPPGLPLLRAVMPRRRPVPTVLGPRLSERGWRCARGGHPQTCLGIGALAEAWGALGGRGWLSTKPRQRGPCRRTGHPRAQSSREEARGGPSPEPAKVCTLCSRCQAQTPCSRGGSPAELRLSPFYRLTSGHPQHVYLWLTTSRLSEEYRMKSFTYLCFNINCKRNVVENHGVFLI